VNYYHVNELKYAEYVPNHIFPKLPIIHPPKTF